MERLLLFSPLRLYRVFRLLLTLFLLIKKRDRFLSIQPLSPEELRDHIITLGASFIKLAQVLATRADFFPQDYLERLKELHDEIPPMPQKSVEAILSLHYPTLPFESFSYAPIASASIGQVHTAYLGGKKVAIKLRRDGVAKRVYADIAILKLFNFIFQPLFSEYTQHSIESLIVEFGAMIKQEVDFTLEAKNLLEFSNCYSDCGVTFPKLYNQYSNIDTLVMSFEEGYRFDDRENLSKCGVDFRHIMQKLVLFYVKQMLLEGYFHADPHPGNLLVRSDGELIFLDFGMVKRIGNSTRISIIELIKSANEQDFELYVIACKKLGIIAKEAPQHEMEEFSSKMFEIFNDANLSSASMQLLAFEVLDSMKNLPFKLPQEAIYILRVSALIEGLGTTYIENFNGVKDILPILKENLQDALGAHDGGLSLFTKEIKSLPLSFIKIKNIINKMHEGALEVRISEFDISLLLKEQKKTIKKASLFLALIATTIALYLGDDIDTFSFVTSTLLVAMLFALLF